MKNVTLNPDYARRHLFVALLMLGMGCWFGYDGLVSYPQMEAAALYESIEKAKPQPGVDLEAFKRQKIQTQYGFTLLCLIASAWVGVGLWKAKKFAFGYDEKTMVFGGRTYAREDVEAIDDAAWEKKRILVLKMKDGVQIKLDAWHHLGVKEFVSTLKV